MYKTQKILKTLPVLLIFFTSCKTNSPFSTKNTAFDNAKLRKEVVAFANSLTGVKYKYGGDNPSKGFDCSGYTYYVFKKFNIYLPRSSRAQAKRGKKIALKKAKPGDLIFFKNKNRINHVGIITGNNNGHLYVIHSTSSAGVKKDDVINNKYWKKRITFVRDIISR